MSDIVKEIIIGAGIKGLKFGMDRDAVKNSIGSPDEIEQYTDEESDELLNEAWHYDDIELSLSFDKEEEWKLCTISVSDPDFTLNGKKLIGANEADLLEFIDAEGLGSHDSEEWSTEDDETQKVLSIDEKSLNFWFTEGAVTEIQWGPLYTEDDQTIWPS